MLGAGHPASAMFAGDKPALPVTGVAIRESGRLPEHANRPGLLLPFHETVVGNVAPEEITAVPESDRAFAPSEARREPLHARTEQDVLCEGWVEDLDRGVGVSFAGLPHRAAPVFRRSHSTSIRPAGARACLS